MPCYHPLQAWKGPIQASGKSSIVFSRKGLPSKSIPLQLDLPCGQCIGCRLERSRQWAMRCLHEASLYENNCFITLTYDGARLPVDGSLSVRPFQLFMKKLRKKYGSGIRFFQCGEYGEVCRFCGKSKKYCGCGNYLPSIGRPHYHACLFNHDFADKELISGDSKIKLYYSRELEELWGNGYCTLGEVTFDSAAYVARYCVKKINGVQKEVQDKSGLTHYQKLNPVTGVVNDVKPEYTTMSRGSKKLNTGGIGKGWYKKYKFDIYPQDFAIIRGRKVKPPKFYDGIYEQEDPEIFAKLKLARQNRNQKTELVYNKQLKRNQLLDVNRWDRLAVKEEATALNLNNLRRSLED